MGCSSGKLCFSMSILASSLSLSNTHAETHLWQCLHFHKGSWEIPCVFHSSGTQSYVNLETDNPSCHWRMEILDGCVDFKPVSSFILGRQPFPTPTPKSFPILLFEFAISDPSWPRKLNYLKVRLDKMWLASWGLSCGGQHCKPRRESVFKLLPCVLPTVCNALK